LFLSTNQEAAAKVMITEETGCCAGFSAHESPPQALTAGQVYYIEAIYKEGTGGDYGQVAAKLDSDPTDPNSLSSINFGLGGLFDPNVAPTLTLTQQPVARTNFANSLVTFTVAATRTPAGPISYQWRSNGVDVPFASSATLTFGPVALEANGAVYDCLVSVP